MFQKQRDPVAPGPAIRESDDESLKQYSGYTTGYLPKNKIKSKNTPKAIVGGKLKLRAITRNSNFGLEFQFCNQKESHMLGLFQLFTLQPNHIIGQACHPKASINRAFNGLKSIFGAGVDQSQ